MAENAKKSGWDGTIFGQPAIDASAERSKRVERKDVELFAEITGDRNPLHFDQEIAGKSVFGGLIAHGGITSGILNALVAEDLPGPGTVFLAVEWKFTKAVHLGDLITGRVQIKTVRDDKPICTLSTVVKNQAGEVCLEGSATTYTVPLKQTES